jgi:hypothetical protein
VRRTALVLLGAAIVAVPLLAACASGKETDADRLTAPKLGACRDLGPADVEKASNGSDIVPCTEDHTAQTFAVGPLPSDTGKSYRAKGHGTFVFRTCQKALNEFLGVDESLAMRIQLSWAWFRPSEKAWEKGARWYRCDVVGGPVGAKKLRDLPEDARGLFTEESPDAWTTCARGPSVAKSTKVACSEKHDWRAVTTVKVGRADDPYPGDRIVQVRSRDYCAESVLAWLHYPSEYEWGYSWFREAQWLTGNRRSVCWARTTT